ncbi:MAG: chitobiase/beta-hexosaminidase C-terminal domain-containing protein, partial [Pirellulales bacterium]|nr:chitobiase/beta-hexosaminidase C-terminal domain-containing protein [Pirellulales bacterium]
MVVFASSKDGDPSIPASELHTNFNLDADGGYLGLVMPDGETIVHEYAPVYPRQLTDISYGAGGDLGIDDSFIAEGAGVAILVPTDGSLGTTWTGGQPFDDSTWQHGTLGVGYDTEGSTNWLYSLIDVGLLGQRIEPGAVGAGSTGNGANLPTTELQSDTGDPFTITIDNKNQVGSSVGQLDWRDRGNGPDDALVALGEDHVKNNAGIIRVTLGSLPEGIYSVTSYHMDADFNQCESIRIFVTDATGTNMEQAIRANANIIAGGVKGLTTSEVISTSATYTITSDGISDIIVLFDGSQASDREVPLSGLQIERLGGAYEGLIETNLQGSMYEQTTTAYLRIPFDVADPSAFSLLSLNIHYDDGFVAYLNGVKIAERNAPPDPSFDSFASASHPDTQALIPEPIDVSAHLADLVAGENILAIHGLNIETTSTDFLILPFLTATRTMVSPATYYTTPTPGAINVPGALGIVGDTEFSMDRGFYDAPFSVEITTDTADAEIRYTRDGSIPTATTGLVYTEPIMIASTTILRSAAFKPGYLATNVDTQTYLFLDDVFQQNETFGIDGTGLAPYAAWGHSGPDWEV